MVDGGRVWSTGLVNQLLEVFKLLARVQPKVLRLLLLDVVCGAAPAVCARILDRLAQSIVGIGVINSLGSVSRVDLIHNTLLLALNIIGRDIGDARRMIPDIAVHGWRNGLGSAFA